MSRSANRSSELSVGEMAARSGVPVSTIHYYESLGLIEGWRNAGNHRRYDRSQLRRVAIVKVAQKLGVPLATVAAALSELPPHRKPTARDWAAMSARWHETLSQRIEQLVKLRDHLDYCIGCGCLSVDNCPLYNPDDRLGLDGPGPRRLDPGG